MSIKAGDYLFSKTVTRENVFGDCVWIAKDFNYECPLCPNERHGILFELVGGTGPSANPGRQVIDCPNKVESDIKKKVSRMLTEEQGKAYKVRFASQPPPRRAPSILD